MNALSAGGTESIKLQEADAPVLPVVNQRRPFLLLPGCLAAACLLEAPDAARAELKFSFDYNYKAELARRRRKVPIEEFSDGPQVVCPMFNLAVHLWS